MVPTEFIEQVRLANNIVTVAGRYLSVKKKGRDYWAPCRLIMKRHQVFE